jgi:hypothetical protein
MNKGKIMLQYGKWQELKEKKSQKIKQSHV